MLKKFFHYLTKPRAKYKPLIKILIARRALLHNYDSYAKAYGDLAIAPMLKSNAYGHGLREVGKILDAKHPPFFAVDSFFEALVLRQAQVQAKILIIGYTRKDVWERKTLKNLSYAILGMESLREIALSLKTRQNFHLKIDTGMHRHGILPADFEEAAKLIASNQNIVLEGLCSHFANAYSQGDSFTKAQIAAWNRGVEFFQSRILRIKYLHTAATPGFPQSRSIKANVARIGIGLYGIDTSPRLNSDLEPVLEMRSVVATTKQISARERVGYNLLFESVKPMILGTIPAGYNDGVDLRLTNQGAVRVAGEMCKIVGRVSMNVTTIDLSAVKDPSPEEEATIISRIKSDANSVENIAKICHTSPYEILVHIHPNLRREIV